MIDVAMMISGVAIAILAITLHNPRVLRVFTVAFSVLCFAYVIYVLFLHKF
ncbi:MAG TPA: hypothetical protein VGI81_24730 [Tepidisphaeraceae bacterium]|jgi:hypothetical protein